MAVAVGISTAYQKNVKGNLLKEVIYFSSVTHCYLCSLRMRIHYRLSLLMCCFLPITTVVGINSGY